MGREKTLSKTFEAKLSYLHESLRWVMSLLKEEGMAPKEIKKVELALEEAIVNIIHHAYQDKAGQIEMIYSNVIEGWVQFTLKDQGPPFDPNEGKHSFTPPSSSEEQELGGLGVPLIHSLVDVVEYRREGKINILTLRKKLLRSSNTL